MEIYQPAEDSFLLSKFVKKEIEKIKPIKVLDMGSGSGIQAEACISAGIAEEDLTLADINKKAISHLKLKFPHSRIILSDLFSKIPDYEKFDLIIFNPPYLPNSKFDKQPDISGGKNGSHIINQFLKQAKSHLTKKGKIILLTSSHTKKINFLKYKKKLLGKKKLFFEELWVWGLS